MQYIKNVSERIEKNSEYISDLDSATGDGDHYSNISIGFESLNKTAEEIISLDLKSAFVKIGTIMMTVIGGSGGILYGSAYLQAAKTLDGKEYLENQDVCNVLRAMLNGIMSRGKSEPGMKTMIDSLYPAVECYESCIKNNISIKETLMKVKQAAIDGAENTRNMEAVRGRAYYQSNKGVGHLDPGAVTMSYQVEELADFLLDKVV